MSSVLSLVGFVSVARPTLNLGFLRSPRKILRAHVEVVEAFNSNGTDTLVVGNVDNPDAYIESVDVSTTGIKTVTLGSEIGFSATPFDVTAVYTAGGTAPTTGAAIIILEIMPCPQSPA